MKKLLFLLLFISSAQAAAPVPSCTPARTSGVAPLYVFLDCTSTTDADTSTPFHDLEYRHSFGDPSAGLWAYGANTKLSKNQATGPIVGHIYETAGTYYITTQVYDGTSTAQIKTSAITVTNPDTVFSTTNTICFSNAATFTGCPTGATQVTTSNFVTALSSYHGTTKRLLFRRGDTFTAATPGVITATGPGTIGSFGTGAKPTIQSTANSTILYLSSASTPSISDWRIMDLILDSQGGTTSIGIDAQGGISQVTILRTDVTATRLGFSASDVLLDYWNANGNPGHDIWDQWAIVDSIVLEGVGSHYGTYLSGDRLFFAGNYMDNNSSGSHVTRFPYLGKSVISNNTLSSPGLTEHSIKLHAPIYQVFTGDTHGSTTIDAIANSTGVAVGRTITGSGIPASTTVVSTTSTVNGSIVISQAATSTAAGVSLTMNSNEAETAGLGDGYSRWIIIADNTLTGASNDWTVALGPQDGGKDERVKDIIVERNWFTAGSGTQISVVAWATYTTIRNNVINSSSSDNTQMCIATSRRGIELSPDNNNIYNNTCYTNYAVPNAQFNAVNVGAGATNITIKNNLAYAPNATNPKLVYGDGAASAVGAAGTMGNSSDAQVKNTSPSFAGATPSEPLDFRILTDSYAVNSGSAVPVAVTQDFYNCKDKNGNVRAGAMVPKANAMCRGVR